jgi:glutamate racemase
MGENVHLVDSAYETAREVNRILAEMKMERRHCQPPAHRYFVSDNPEKFIEVGERFLKRPIDPISVIDPQVGR